MPKKHTPPPLPTQPPIKEKETLGLSPAVLGKRDFVKKEYWCPVPPSIDFDPYSDPFNPKAVDYNKVVKADEMIKEIFQSTPLLFPRTVSVIRFAYVDARGTSRRCIYGVCRKLGYGFSLSRAAASRACDCGAPCAYAVVRHQSLSRIWRHCRTPREDHLRSEKTSIQINTRSRTSCYDHPNVIAAAGSIGVEILDQLPDTEAILVPIGGGGLIAGIAAYVKHIKPNVLIYGIEPGKSCGFAKAIHNERPYKIEAEMGLAASLTIPKVGDNAFHTAKSLIDKMVLIHDDFTARAIVHLIEMEKIIAEGAGAISLGALMCMPDILTELQGKKVVTIVSGGNIDLWPLKRAMIQGKAVEHRVVPLNLIITPRNTDLPSKAFKVFEQMDCNMLHCEYSGNHDWFEEGKLMQHSLTVIVETKGHKHACLLRHVMEKLFPGECEFDSEVFKPIVICSCFPKLIY
ncbi:uncharacterized protein LOC111350441 isoform X2 [Spodoptera litura]|uniref:L-serine deaminase n=1 Tax=Spodoptera litura TaxID=69820 RepID=A0A9J7IM12_SPOLT|nr:uncharacterized protein LOC111350441 isoform X2 [Spodoptera litura]